MVGNSSLHRWSNAQALMDAAERLLMPCQKPQKEALTGKEFQTETVPLNLKD
jgi:hypothetical protein